MVLIVYSCAMTLTMYVYEILESALSPPRGGQDTRQTNKQRLLRPQDLRESFPPQQLETAHSICVYHAIADQPYE